MIATNNNKVMVAPSKALNTNKTTAKKTPPHCRECYERVAVDDALLAVIIFPCNHHTCSFNMFT